MSNVLESTRIRVVMADYAIVDHAGKLNVIGGGLRLLGHNPQTALTQPFAVVVQIWAPAGSPVECSLELQLEDDSGRLVALPGPTGEPQPMRLAQLARLEEPRAIGGLSVPHGLLRISALVAVNFNTGLPLVVGARYLWRVRVDQRTEEGWTEEFFVPGPQPGPVMG